MEIIEKAYKYRIYPNKTQKIQMEKTFGCCRFVYNYYLDKRISLYKENNTSFSYNDCSKDLTILKREKEWLQEVDATALQSSLRNLDDAYKKFFKKQSTGFPKFKSKKTHRFSYKTKNNHNTTIQYSNRRIKLPKLGWVKTKDRMIPEGRILNATVSQTPSGKYYVSLCCTDVVSTTLPLVNHQIGIDVGILHFATTNEGLKIENPKFLHKSLSKLAFLQRSLSRKTRGGSNWNKARIKVARVQEHIANQRNDFLQKLSTEIIQNNDVICLETLDIKEMKQSKSGKQGKTMNRNINDASWAEFGRQLQYKADWYGRRIIKIDQYYPSSQICSNCGNQNISVKDLSIREWICPACDMYHDRDINAAKNILNEGLHILNKSKSKVKA